ncbi:hypothetical protein [Dulcicalothrix desertica]|uniref:hypothetical protein n=1 Tax=Dulcicalothrix desertica TaxID=32056 RepID=UPI0013155CA7|nr:hypothetical protein [Dulcicalothrix desertica]
MSVVIRRKTQQNQGNVGFRTRAPSNLQILKTYAVLRTIGIHAYQPTTVRIIRK